MWILSTTFFLLFLQSEMDITKRVQLSSFITKVVPTLGHYFSPLDSKVQYLCTFDFSCFGWARENFRRNNWRLRQVSFVQLSQQLQWNCQLQILCKWIKFKTVPPVMLFWVDKSVDDSTFEGRTGKQVRLEHPELTMAVHGSLFWFAMHCLGGHPERTSQVRGASA